MKAFTEGGRGGRLHADFSQPDRGESLTVCFQTLNFKTALHTAAGRRDANVADDAARVLLMIVSKGTPSEGGGV